MSNKFKQEMKSGMDKWVINYKTAIRDNNEVVAGDIYQHIRKSAMDAKFSDSDWEELSSATGTKFGEMTEEEVGLKEHIRKIITEEHPELFNKDAYVPMNTKDISFLLEDAWEDAIANGDKGTQSWEGYEAAVTFDTVTPESAEFGDVNDSGFEYEWGELLAMSLEELLKSEVPDHYWVSWSDTPPTDESWIISEEDNDMYDGSNKSYNLHIRRADGNPLLEEEIWYITKVLDLR
jgi:hypothetical protein